MYSCDSNKTMLNNTDDKIIFSKVYYDGRKLVEDTAKIEDRIEIINLASVLIFYGESFEIDFDHNIWVSKTLLKNKDYIYNISNKSEDTLWLKEHVWKTKW